MNARIVSIAAAFSIALLAGCGGGGSGGGDTLTAPPTNPPDVNPTPIVTPTPVSTTGPLPTPSSVPATAPPVSTPTPGATPTPASIVSNIATQAQAAQSVLIPMSGLSMIGSTAGIAALIPSLPSVSANAAMRREANSGGGGNAGPFCKNGKELTGLPGAYGAESYVLAGFYDGACTQKEYELDATLITYQSTSGMAVWGQGVQTYYDHGGHVVGMANLSNIYVGGLNSQSVTTNLRGSIALTGGLTSAALGNECQAQGGAMSCANGMVVNSTRVGSSFGSILNSHFPSLQTLSGATMSVSGYAGALGSLTLVGPAASAPIYSIIGGVPSPAVTIAAGASQITITDPSNDATLQITTASNGALSGTVVQTSTGKQVAQFAADAYGVGTITFGNGSTSQIVGYMVL